jgi:hypothetical protein
MISFIDVVAVVESGIRLAYDALIDALLYHLPEGNTIIAFVKIMTDD